MAYDHPHHRYPAVTEQEFGLHHDRIPPGRGCIWYSLYSCLPGRSLQLMVHWASKRSALVVNHAALRCLTLMTQRRMGQKAGLPCQSSPTGWRNNNVVGMWWHILYNLPRMLERHVPFCFEALLMFHSCNSYDARSIPFWKVLFTWRYLASAGSPDATVLRVSLVRRQLFPQFKWWALAFWSFILSWKWMTLVFADENRRRILHFNLYIHVNIW